MGLFDTIEIDDSIEVPWDEEPDRGWQTKQLGRPSMATYRINEQGHLMQLDYGWPSSNNEEEEDLLHRVPYHGMIEFHGTIDNELQSFEAKFTDGELDEITENGTRGQ